MLTIIAKGLGRYRIEDQSTGFVLNCLNMAALAHHLTKVLKLNATERADVYLALTTDGKVKIERVELTKVA